MSDEPASSTADFGFTLWDAEVGGNMIGSAVAVENVPITDGLFTVELDFGVDAFSGDARWLELSVASPSGAALTTLSPRQPLTATPYAQTSVTALNTPNAWSLGGNLGTDSDNDFLGTLDLEPLVLKSNDLQVLRMEYDESGGISGINVTGGLWLNEIESGAVGSTVFGGARQFADLLNRSYDVIGTVGGGADNKAGSNVGDTGTAIGATVGGGLSNQAREKYSTVSGGWSNNAFGQHSAIGGGSSNTADGFEATIAGGTANNAGGQYSMVAGGRQNNADGQYAFAAGRRAKAGHNGAFVWGDSQNSDFASTCNNQFLIRASGNVGINKNDPATALDVEGTITSTAMNVAETVTAAAFVGDGSGLTNLPEMEDVLISTAGDIYYEGGRVGIGTDTPTASLDVQGDLKFSSRAATLDQAQESASTTALSPDNILWQSFKAGEDGQLTQLDLRFHFFTTAESGTLTIYQGEGITGAVLSTTMVDFPSGVEEWVSFPIAASPIVQAGSTYTFSLETESGELRLSAESGDPYPDGHMDAELFVQTFDLAFRTFESDGSGIVGKLIVRTANALDQAREVSTTSTQAGGWWQSFTAGTNGTLSKVDVRVNSSNPNASCTLEIRSGQGSSGTLLATQSFDNFPVGTTAWATISLSEMPQMVSGQQYTIRFPSTYSFRASTTDPYPGGQLQSQPGADMAFRTYVTDPAVGIGRSPTTNTLEVERTASKSTAGAWLANSDRRIKSRIHTIEHALDTLDKVRLVSFEYTDDYKATHRGVGDGRYLNVIAQEFAEVFPDHVKGSGELLPDGSEILQVDTYPLTIYSAAAIQELHQQLRAKDAQISRIQEVNAQMMRRLELLEAELGSQMSQLD